MQYINNPNKNPGPPNYHNIYGGASQQKLQLHLNEAHQVIKKHSVNANGFKIEPKGIEFATQNPGEKVFVYIRRHWSENIDWMIRNAFYCIIPFILAILLNVLKVELNFISRIEIISILLMYYSLIVTNVFKDFFDWYFDPYIITNERIVHYEFKPFTKYEVKETALISIENVTEESAGLIAGLLGYGTLTISTEAQNDLFIFKRIPNPTKVRDIVVDLTKVARKYHGDID